VVLSAATHGPDHELTLDAEWTLAGMYRLDDRPAAAIPLYEHVYREYMSLSSHLIKVVEADLHRARAATETAEPKGYGDG
jgi:hypothetical protein